jgi:hypothetical protein
MRPTKKFEQLLNDSWLGSETLKELQEYECDLCGAGYAFYVGYSMWNCSVPQKEHPEWGEFWRPGYHVCLDCYEAGVAGFPDRLRKHAEALEERAAELRKLVNAKWQPIELDDAAALENDPIPKWAWGDEAKNRLKAKHQ